MLETLPAAVKNDLIDLFRSALPAGLALIDSARCQLEHEKETLPCPRLVFRAGDPKPVARQDGTGTLPVMLDVITSLDRTAPSAHVAEAGKIDGWLRGLRALYRRDVLSSRIYLHDIMIQQPTESIRKDEHEQVTTLRVEIIATLVAPQI